MSDAFDTLAAEVGAKKLPPVHLWNPQHVDEIDIRIRDDGVWFHDGREISRKSIARVFSTILAKDGEDFYLVTPVDKLKIKVDDAPFVVVDFESSGRGEQQKIIFKTNMDDVVPLDVEHPIFVTFDGDEPRPYLRVRGELDALILRGVFYRLVDLIEDDDATLLSVWSYGHEFRLGQID